MAMMMAGRVLLVCALCVLWCGAGGRCEEAGTGDTLPVASSNVVRKGSQESSPVAQGGSQSSGLKASDMKDGTEDSGDQQPLTEDVDDEEEEEDEEEILPPGGGGGGVPQAADGKLEKVNESGPKPENQRQVEGGTKKQPEKETEANGQMKVTKKEEGSGPQPNNHQTPVQEENTRNVEGQQPSQEKEQQTNVEEIPRNPAGDRSSGEHSNNDGSNDVEEGEEGVEGHERDWAQEREVAAHVSGAPKVNSTDIQQEVQRTHAGETPTGMKQRAGEEKDDETEEEREEQKEQHQENPPGKEQETVTGANATNQINTTPGDSDGSTAVSHTTSPLLLLLVAFAAAAVVAA
ncbi:mucin-associated surface protein [Trypanosoma cruzi cruzi]|uniref:Mucin-associated surface protein (MASP) n=1 Tax=Trypanosoma cruzi TaxID=5693 RepID=A0A2V2URE0_TRYCR|nr:mucin-associated surface protein [Trypanosoma cruzi cruzi]PWU86917.1 Mucin-associated surface protein (MASP) [Trypanosoma cruzi]